MTMSYDETAQLMRDATFRGRVSVACVNFSRYITDEAVSTPAHATRYRWAQATLLSPENAVNQVMPTVVTDTAVQDAGGAAITDASLQSAVETAVNKLL
jgi:nicotinic acid phosphoribosyltransferase